MTPVSHGKPCAGNPHARFEEGASASETPRRNALLHTNMKKFFAALSERAYKENDLSDVTYAMCESDICFKQFFLNFFFNKDNLDASSTSIEREHSTDWGRPDFWIRGKDGTLYIVEVKIWDGSHHFEQYYDILAGNNALKDSSDKNVCRNNTKIWKHLGYIANYDSIKTIKVFNDRSANEICGKVATWKEFITELEDWESRNETKDPMIAAYVLYVRNVCPFDDFILQDWLKNQRIADLKSAFQEIQGVSNSISKAIEEFQENGNGKKIGFKSYTRSSRKFIPQYRMGSFFEFDMPNNLPSGQGQRVWGWLGVYYRNEGGVICIEFEDREGWGKPVCDKFRPSVKDGGLRFYLKKEYLKHDNIQNFLTNVVHAIIEGSVGVDCPAGEDGAKKFESLLAMKAFPIMLEQKLFGASTAIRIGDDSYKFSLASGSDAEVPESHCGRYFELTKDAKNTAERQSLSEQEIPMQKNSVRGWVGVMYSSHHTGKGGKYMDDPQFVIEIEKSFAYAQLKGVSGLEWYDDSWGWKCYDIDDGPLDCVASKVEEALQKLSQTGS